MTIEELAAIGELIGGLGVLATLIFLAMEVRRSSRLLRINAQTSANEVFAGYNERLAEQPELLELFDRVLRGENISSFSAVEQFRVTVSIRALLQLFEAQYFQFKGGLIDEGYWGSRIAWLRSMLNNPAMGDWWQIESNSAQLTPEFVDHINAVEPSAAIGPTGQLRAS